LAQSTKSFASRGWNVEEQTIVLIKLRYEWWSFQFHAKFFIGVVSVVLDVLADSIMLGFYFLGRVIDIV
jgi:hypothetical protein